MSLKHVFFGRILLRYAVLLFRFVMDFEGVFLCLAKSNVESGVAKELEKNVKANEEESDGDIDNEFDKEESEFVADDVKDDDYKDEDHISGKQKLFSTKEANVILESCEMIIKHGPISRERVKRELVKTAIGKHIFEKYDMTQIQTRIKYERLKKKRNINKH